MIQMYLHSNSINWKLLDGGAFVGLRNVLDNTMKERHAMGLGVRKSADVITIELEKKLLDANVIGLDDPEQLLNGVIYFLGMYLALRGVAEHNALRRPGCNPQISVEHDSRGIKCLVYREDLLSKTNQGGLNARGRKAKTVYVYPVSDIKRDPVTYYEKYIGLLPTTFSSKKLYCRVKKKTTPSQWYNDQPYGINKLKTAVKSMCRQAGLEGKFTNHSLRATCATRMFDNHVPEQIIKETTGHTSDCVRTYKRTSDNLRQKASSTLSNNAIRSGNSRVGWSTQSSVCIPKVEKHDDSYLSIEQMEANVRKTRFELRQKLYPKSRLKLKSSKKLVKNATKHMVTIDVNVKVKPTSKKTKKVVKKSS